jgi:hypothetical protein
MSKLGICMVVGGFFIIGHAIGHKDKEGKLPRIALQKMETFVRGLRIEDYFKKEVRVYPSSPLPMVIGGFDLGMLKRFLGSSRLPKPKPIGWQEGEREYRDGYYRRDYRRRNGYGNGYYNGNGYRDRYIPRYNPYDKYRFRDRDLDDLIDVDDDGEFNLDLRIRAK